MRLPSNSITYSVAECGPGHPEVLSTVKDLGRVFARMRKKALGGCACPDFDSHRNAVEPLMHGYADILA